LINIHFCTADWTSNIFALPRDSNFKFKQLIWLAVCWGSVPQHSVKRFRLVCLRCTFTGSFISFVHRRTALTQERKG